jgi:hypothetical protein
MGEPTVWVAIIGGISTVAGVLITQWQGRRQRDAQVQQITAAAHDQIYGAYADLLAGLRADAAASREEAIEARRAARAAETRAAEAEVAAAGAEARARYLEILLTEIRRVVEHGAPDLLVQINQILQQAPA